MYDQIVQFVFSTGTRLGQPVVTDSPGVVAEWGDGPLDAMGDAKRVSRQEVAGSSPVHDDGSSEGRVLAKYPPHFQEPHQT